MAETVPRTRFWKSTYDLVVISPAMTTRPVAVKVSQATRLEVSSVRQASRMASEIWSAILSGWPSVTDSEVNRWRFFDKLLLLASDLRVTNGGDWSAHNDHETSLSGVHSRLPENPDRRNNFGPSRGFLQ